MLYTIPDYYKEFQCVADRCEDTCCAGWQIVIDQETLKKYKKIKGDFRKRIWKSVNWFQGTFRQDKDKRCAFLNENNLCDLYLSQGEEGFCKTCREYPRHTEEFEGVREITLSISCPEVARMLMSRVEPVKFLNYEKEGEEEFEDFDPFLYSILEEARKEMISILQNRALSIEERVVLVLGMAHDIQGRVKRQTIFEGFDVIEKYTTPRALEYAKAYACKKQKKRKDVRFAYRMFCHLQKLELLKEEWGIWLEETKDLLYSDQQKYKKLQEEFTYYLKNPKESLYVEKGNRQKSECQRITEDILMEQLLVYFLFTYFPGAVYDGEVYAKVQMSVYLVWMIREMWLARWIKNEKTLNMEEMTELVYRLSREVEHSDLNLKQIEKVMQRKWFLT